MFKMRRSRGKVRLAGEVVCVSRRFHTFDWSREEKKRRKKLYQAVSFTSIGDLVLARDPENKNLGTKFFFLSSKSEHEKIFGI